MNEYKFTYNDEDLNYTCMSSVENQTIEVCFSGWFKEVRKMNHWYVSACIYNKRKSKYSNYENFVSSGSFGIKGLIEIKNIILRFEEFIKNEYPNENNWLAVYGSDAKRSRVYKAALTRLGFSFGIFDGYLMNYKKIL